MPSSSAQVWCTNQPRTVSAPEAEAATPPVTSFEPTGELWEAVEAIYSATGANGNVWRFDAEALRTSSNVGDGVEADDLIGFVHDWRNPSTIGSALTQEGSKRPDFTTVSGVTCGSFVGDQDTNDNEHLLTPSLVNSPEGTLVLVGRITDATDTRQCLFEAGPWRLDGVFDGTPPAVRVGSSQWKQFGLSSTVNRWSCFVIQWSTATNTLRLYYDGGADWAEFAISSWMSNTIGALNRNSYISNPASSPYGAPATAAYKSVVWCDQWLTNVDQLQDFVDFAVDGTSIDITIPTASTSGSNDGTIPTPTIPVVNVTNASQLTAALADDDLIPGTHIVLANGTYSGTFNTSKAGTSSNPIVIKALNFGVPVVNGQIVLNNPFNVVYGLDFSSSKSEGNVYINADDCRMLRCTTTNSTRGVRVNTGKKRFEIAYCHFDGGANSIQIRVAGNTTTPMYGWVHHNLLEDSSGNPIEQGTNGTHSAVPLSVLSEYNLALRCGDNSSIACKSSDNVFFRNTLRDCEGARMQARHGRRDIFMSNYLENSAGILLNGEGHLSIGNYNDYAAGTGNYDVHGAACGDKWQADFEGTAWTFAYHPPAENCTFIQNLPFVRIGAGGLTKGLNARNNTIQSTTSSWEQNSYQTNTTKVTTLSRSVPGRVPLTSDMVGPLATPAGESYQNLYGGSYGPTITPSVDDLLLNPFNSESAHHRSVLTSATYTNPDAVGGGKLFQAHLGTGNINDNKFGHFTAYGKESDPEKTLTWDGTNAGSSGFPVTLHVPSGFPSWDSSSESGDRACSIIDSDGNGHNFFWYNKTSNTGARHLIYDIRGLGHGTVLGSGVGTSASKAVGLMGAMRKHEAETPGLVIRHAHHMAVPRRSDHNAPQFLGTGIQWPACGADSGAGTANIGNLKYGALIAIPTVSDGGPDLDAMLSAEIISEVWYRYMVAFRDYGIYLMDGAEVPVFRVDNVLNSTTRTELQTGFRTQFWQYVMLVSNSVTGATGVINSNGTYSGSIGTPTTGTPLASNSALV